MIRVLLLHAGIIPHYRVPIYSYLTIYLKRYGFDLMVTSDGIQSDNPHAMNFQYVKMPLSIFNITRLIYSQKIDVIIDYMELRHRYLFPTYLIAKGIMSRKMIYWGQGRDLADINARIKNLAYAAEQAFSDAIIIYAEHLKKYVPTLFYKKVFVANNTLHLTYPGLPAQMTKEGVLAKYGIKTKRNIICMGRIQRRKRLDHLVEALLYMNRSDIGLIFVGPDDDGVLNKYVGDNIYKLGPIYGEEKFDLLSSAEVYCLPGAVGLSIIDAFYCGLPFVTEKGDESAEIMYLKDGVNGFSVPKGNISMMAQKLLLLIDDNNLRKRFSDAAKLEITENGSIDKLCAGFKDALCYATGQAGRPAT